jgi:hypothetical protein
MFQKQRKNQPSFPLYRMPFSLEAVEQLVAQGCSVKDIPAAS